MTCKCGSTLKAEWVPLAGGVPVCDTCVGAEVVREYVDWERVSTHVHIDGCRECDACEGLFPEEQVTTPVHCRGAESSIGGEDHKCCAECGDDGCLACDDEDSVAETRDYVRSMRP